MFTTSWFWQLKKKNLCYIRSHKIWHFSCQMNQKEPLAGEMHPTNFDLLYWRKHIAHVQLTRVNGLLKYIISPHFRLCDKTSLTYIFIAYYITDKCNTSLYHFEWTDDLYTHWDHLNLQLLILRGAKRCDMMKPQSNLFRFSLWFVFFSRWLFAALPLPLTTMSEGKLWNESFCISDAELWQIAEQTCFFNRVK